MRAMGLALSIVLALTVLALPASAQSPSSPAAGERRTETAPGSAGARTEGAVQHGAQPNPAEVRPGTREGDAPSAAVGELVRDPEGRRLLRLPIAAVMTIGAVVVGLLIAAGLLVPQARRRRRARGGGTYGRP